jgi:hypothetical protein
MTAAIDQAGLKTGTSMAAPQTAALAAWAWTLRPTLTPQAVMQLLQRTARPPNPVCAGPVLGPLFGAPVIDAYAAVLATDQGFADAPVRRALLDVADAAGNPGQDGRFDERDVQRFLVELDGAGGVSFDFSRFDLNGDARTGGPETEAFDLDMDGVLGPVSLVTPQGSRTLNENAVRDIDVLCFYAFSPLFQGSAAARDQFLAGRCVPTLTVTPASVTVAAGQTVQFTASLVAGVPFTDVTWSVAGGGTISSTGLFTAGTTPGTFTVLATSLGQPPLFGSALVTIAAPAPGAVSVVSRIGEVSAAVFACSGDDHRNNIPSAETSWTSTEVAMASGMCPDPSSASAEASIAETESHVGGNFLGVSGFASTRGSVSGEGATASAFVEYRVTFQVTGSVSWAMSTADTGLDLRLRVPSGSVIAQSESPPFSASGVLAPGVYEFRMRLLGGSPPPPGFSEGFFSFTLAP